MTTEPHTAVDRIPLTRSVHYVARGLPEVPNQYGPGVLAPSEITLTYRAAPDSQLGRVHAYVTGRIWVDGKELPLVPGGLYGQHYMDGLDNWPAWLAEEARLHDPEPTAPAGLGVSATPSHTDQATVLLSEAERLMLRHALDLADANISARPDEYTAADEAALASLRRLADEAQQQEPESGCAHCGGDHSWDACQAYTAVVADAPESEPSVHGESVAHLAGLHGRRDQWAGDEQADFVPPVAEGLPSGALDSARNGATMLDAWAEDPHGRNFLAHALVQLARDGWLRTEPADGFEPVRERDDVPEPQDPATLAAVDARQDGAPS